MLAQKFFQRIGIEISQDMVASHKCRHIGLLGELLHLFVGLSILADVDRRELIAARLQIFLRVDAPGAPLAAIEL